MMISETSSTLIWAHIGDLHITAEDETNYRDFDYRLDEYAFGGSHRLLRVAGG